MRYTIILCAAFAWGCDDELSYPDGSRWQNVSLDPGRSMPQNQREWDRWAAQQQAAPPRDVRTFTPGWTGFSVDPSGDVAYVNMGSYVVMWPEDDTFNGTSNDVVFTMTGLPDEITPSTHHADAMVQVFDNDTSSGSIGRAGILTTGSVTFFIGETDSVTGKFIYPSDNWANTGSKGWFGTIVYTLNR